MKNATEIVCVLDRSGSMQAIKDDAIGGFNQFLSDQKKLPGEAAMTLVQFDDTYEKLFVSKKLQDVEPLNKDTYIPRATTALLDALGKTIDEVGIKLKDTPENDRPNKVIFVIITDGMENASKEYNHQQVMEKVNRQRDIYKWEFIFLAANQDAIKAGRDIGIPASHVANFAATGMGQRMAYGMATNAVCSYRMRGAIHADWNKETDSGDNPQADPKAQEA